jgi:hypothetical protein
MRANRGKSHRFAFFGELDCLRAVTTLKQLSTADFMEKMHGGYEGQHCRCSQRKCGLEAAWDGS